MKKFIAVILMLCLCVVFASCSHSDIPADATASPAPGESTAPEVTLEPTSAPIPDAKTVTAAYAAFVETIQNAWEWAEYDLDHDGINELIVKTGTCEADYMYTFYAYQPENGNIVAIGSENAGHSLLVSDGKDFIVAGGQMGYEWAYRITYENKEFKSEQILDRDATEDGYTQWPETIKVNDLGTPEGAAE